MTQPPKLFALIPCAGQGSRAGTSGAKQYQLLAGQPMVWHTIEAFRGLGVDLVGLWVVVSPADEEFVQTVPDFRRAGEVLYPGGGSTRAATVKNGLKAMLAADQGADLTDWVLVHDAARCLIEPTQIRALIEACQGDEVGGLLAHPAPDTLKTEVQGRVSGTLGRSDKWLAQTPQMFRVGQLLAALEQAGNAVTDESAAMEALGLKPKLVAGSSQNFKVTYLEDFALAQAVLAKRAMEKKMKVRIGEGWDTHALVAGRPLILGGVHVPHSMGLLGHSDADVLVHAIIDALLGAASLGDIGRHFPDTDARFKGADSLLLLAETGRLLAASGYQIGNIDSTIVAQAPKLAGFVDAMCERIAQTLGLDVNQINVKAKTAEKLGPVGQGLSMEARAVALITTTVIPA